MGTVLLAVDNGLMWTVTAAGISIVFAVLLLLVMIFYLFGFIMKRATKGEKTKKSKVEVSTKKVDRPVASAPNSSSATKVVDDGVSPDVVAAISAAVAAYNGGNQYTIRSIKKQQVSAGRPAWSMAGVADNTRPF